MARYVVLYSFTAEGAKNIRSTVTRARETRRENERRGFKIEQLLWTQGPHDMVAIVEAPSEEAMMGAMANIVAAGNVSSTTMRAFNETEMERILKQSATSSRSTNGASKAKVPAKTPMARGRAAARK